MMRKKSVSVPLMLEAEEDLEGRHVNSDENSVASVEEREVLRDSLA
jgi:hypothetical protein